MFSRSQRRRKLLNEMHLSSPPSDICLYRSAACCLILVSCHVVSSSGATRPDEIAALQAFQSAVTNPKILAWDGLSDPCASVPWIACSVDSTGLSYVTFLSVANFGLGGSVSPALGNLTDLQQLYLSGNDFMGTVPSSLGSLSGLKEVHLSNNRFSTLLAGFFGGLTSLTTVVLDTNRYSNFEVPTEIAQLPNLRFFSATNCSMNGSIPSSYGNLSSLTYFSLAENNIVGTIPAGFGTSLSSLTGLFLNNNQLTGAIPAALSSASLLTQLGLQGNQLSGVIPPELGNLSSLHFLSVAGNLLVGPIPPSLGSIKTLSSLSLAANSLTGPLPSFTSNYPPSSFSNNGFCSTTPGANCSADVSALLGFLGDVGYPPILASWRGGDPCSWTGIGCSSGVVTSLVLVNKGLTGPLSARLGELAGLTTLVLSSNSLSGPVPSGLTTLPALRVINLSNNALSGLLPLFPSTVTQNLGGNNFTILAPPPAPAPAVVPAPPPASAPTAPAPMVPPSPLSAPPPSAIIILPPSPPVVVPSPPPPPPTQPPPSRMPFPPPPPTPTALPPSPTGLISGGGAVVTPAPQKKGSSFPIVAVVVPLLSLLLLLLLIAALLYRRRKNAVHMRVASPTSSFGGASAGSTLASVSFPASYRNGSVDTKIRIDSGSYSQGSVGTFSMGGVLAEDMLIPIEVILAATGDFDKANVVGRGGFGVVYRGVLGDGTKVAVKRMSLGPMSSKGQAEFEAEIGVLTRVRHRHLVGLLGFVIDGYERLLVYEFLDKGPLSRHLFEAGRLGLHPLTWKMRVSIALDVARGVDYLHSLAHSSFIHRDLKPSNVLLDASFRAKVADFGLVKHTDGMQSVHTRVAGTFGYLAPEYAVTGRVTTKSDVYSFGVVLMELISGRRALDDSSCEEESHLAAWFPQQASTPQGLAALLDPAMEVEEEETGAVGAVALLAVQCCVRDPKQRPHMSNAVALLTPMVQTWKPQDPLEDTAGGIDMAITLKQALQQWKDMGEGDDLPGAYLPEPPASPDKPLLPDLARVEDQIVSSAMGDSSGVGAR